MPRSVDVLLEIGAKRTFACAADWPGWCRAGRDEAAAIDALAAYGARYAGVLSGHERFTAPASVSAFTVVERMRGNATTDFGAPDGASAWDDEPATGRSWARWRRVLEASWAAFDGAVEDARGVMLTTGPRGGGRRLDAIVDHVVGAEAGYLRRLTAAGVAIDEDDGWGSREAERAAVLDGLDRARAGDVPEAGPRGGKMWAPARFMRRATWHVLDHAWEIEDRSERE